MKATDRSCPSVVRRRLHTCQGTPQMYHVSVARLQANTQKTPQLPLPVSALWSNRVRSFSLGCFSGWKHRYWPYCPSFRLVRLPVYAVSLLKAGIYRSRSYSCACLCSQVARLFSLYRGRQLVGSRLACSDSGCLDDSWRFFVGCYSLPWSYLSLVASRCERWARPRWQVRSVRRVSRARTYPLLPPRRHSIEKCWALAQQALAN